MRVLAVLCLAFAVVAAEETGFTGAPETPFVCLHRQIKNSLDQSLVNIKAFLVQLSPSDNINGVISNLTVEYAALQEKLDQRAEAIIQDREVCESRKTIFGKMCGSRARFFFVTGATQEVTGSLGRVIKIIMNAHLDFTKKNVVSNILTFIKQQTYNIIGGLKESAGCIVLWR